MLNKWFSHSIPWNLDQFYLLSENGNAKQQDKYAVEYLALIQILANIRNYDKKPDSLISSNNKN